LNNRNNEFPTNVKHSPDKFARCHALNVIDCIDESSPVVIEGVQKMIDSMKGENARRYDLKVANGLIQKMGR
jgi:hypothetical protein